MKSDEVFVCRKEGEIKTKISNEKKRKKERERERDRERQRKQRLVKVVFHRVTCEQEAPLI